MRLITIFEYTDFKKYLADYYSAKREQDPTFTYRYIAQKAGFKSAGHFTQILKGKIRLSAEMTSKFIDFLALKKKESAYFKLIVQFDQARTHEERRRCFEQILRFKKVKVVSIDPEQYEFYNKWYHSALREIITIIPFSGEDYASLGKQVSPSLTPGEVKKAIRLMERNGMITRDEQGNFQQTDSLISAQPEGKSIAITNQALQTMSLAMEAIDRFPKDQRSISGVAFGLSQVSFEKVQEEIRAFRKRILEIAGEERHPDTVYQFNVQVFPLSNTLKTGGDAP